VQAIEDFLICDFNLLVGFIENQAFELPIVVKQALEYIHHVSFAFQDYLDLLQIIQRDNYRDDQRKFAQAHCNIFLLYRMESGLKNIYIIIIGYCQVLLSLIRGHSCPKTDFG